MSQGNTNFYGYDAAKYLYSRYKKKKQKQKRLKDLCVMCDCQSKVVWQWLAKRHSSNGQAMGAKNI